MRTRHIGTESYISWLDLTPEDVSRAKKFFSALKVEDTIDALGFQPISDTLAGLFYPAITTPMTRARYYIFIPAIYRLVARAPKERIRDQVLSLQIELRNTLLRDSNEGRKRGVIGELHERLERYPAELYWSGLRRLGILKSDLSEPSHVARLERGVSQDLVTDDGVINESNPDEIWDDVPHEATVVGSRLRKSLTFDLTQAERAYLRRRFLESDTTGRSLFSLRLRNRDSRQRDYVWQRPEREFAELLRHSEIFSALARGASYAYERLVQQKISAASTRRGRRPGGNDRSLEGFEKWWLEGRPLVAKWNIERFAELINAERLQMDVWDKRFFSAVQGACARASKATFVELLAPDVRQREQAKRPTKCRLHDRADTRLLEQWRPAKHKDPVYLLGYRHRAGQTILRDLLGLPYLRANDV